MFSLTQKVYQEQSTDLAAKIQKEFRERVNRNDRDVKQAGFWVLYNTKMPSVLVETGFITNQTEEKYLNSKEGQDYLASSIFRACRDYMNEIDSKSGIVVDKNQNSEINPDSLPLESSRTSEISFMVQVASSASRTEIKPENFKGLYDITEIHTRDRFKYAAGNFIDFSAATSYRKKIEVIYPDAFVIAVRDNKILPLQQAFEQIRNSQKE
jgi:N-acetylmuramoyl-L-alanine amidase